MAGGIVAVLLIGALCASWGWRAGLAYASCPPDYRDYDPAQLSYVAEGILEQICELQDELEQVREIQAEAMAAQ